MSKIKAPHIFTSESVSEGHPDKLCDQVSDAILDACLEQDPESRVACECLATTDLLVIAGEITTHAHINYEQIARQAIRDIGYNDPALGFSADTCKIVIAVHKQSPDIAMGVDRAKKEEQGAGDQGMMFGYASRGTPNLMPASIDYAHQLLRRLTELRHSGKHPYLRPDAKSQVSIRYENGLPLAVDTIVVSHQHTESMEHRDLEKLVKDIARKIFPKHLLGKDVKYFINPTGQFIIGGPNGDTGLTGRKIIVDTYGGAGSHGGGAFSGKDPSKVDRSAAYMGRYCAKNIVAAGFAEKCEVQVAYAIGVAEPVSVNVDTYGTGCCPEIEVILQEVIKKGQIFDFRPAKIIEALKLKHPKKNGWSYRQTAVGGHFGRDIFPWEKTDKVAELQKAVKAKLAKLKK